MTPIFVHAVRLEHKLGTNELHQHEDPVLVNLDLVARIYALEQGGCKLEFLSGPALVTKQSIHDILTQRTAQIIQDKEPTNART